MTAATYLLDANALLALLISDHERARRTAADLGHVVGHRQVTDAYLTALAASRDSKLATFDLGLAQALPERTELIP